MILKLGLLLSSPGFVRGFALKSSIYSPSSRRIDFVSVHPRRADTSFVPTPLMPSFGAGKKRPFFSSSLCQAASLINFAPDSTCDDVSNVLHIVGRKSNLESLPHKVLPTSLPTALWQKLVTSTDPGDGGKTASTLYLDGDDVRLISVNVLPEKISRHNSPVQNHAITKLLSKAPSISEEKGMGDGSDILSEKKSVEVLVVVDDESHTTAAAMAVARSYPLYSKKKSTSEKPESDAITYNVRFATSGGLIDSQEVYKNAEAASSAVRMAARIVDTPPAEMNVNDFVKEARGVRDRLTILGHEVAMEVIRDDELRKRGYGGLYSVGKAGIDPPALVVLSTTLSDDPNAEVVTMVGKGIIYDTGGLSLKISGGMCGMKADCGGAAGLLAGFEAALTCGLNKGEKRVGKLSLILCLAENSISSKSFRNDDILTFLSGRTCEINNTDAEGRLVLADGVAHATFKAKRMPDLVLDMATLTGAQLISTGKKHAAIVTNDEETEARAIAAGKRSGDLVHPLLYAPEFLNDEFKSEVADSKNSVKDRSNAQSSCAAQFIGNNLSDEFYENGGKWLHVDMAGPSVDGERGTGYGVGFVLALLDCNGFHKLV